jgi:alpha-amylase
MAVAFHLAWNFGIPRIMSSFAFSGHDSGPPMDANENLLSPEFDAHGACVNGFICQHRWRQIFHMVQFRNVVGSAGVTNWWDNGGNQIAFSRGNRGFIAFNNGNTNMSVWLTTGLPEGTYCNKVRLFLLKFILIKFKTQVTLFPGKKLETLALAKQ